MVVSDLSICCSVVGDGMVGKSSLIQSFVHQEPPSGYLATVVENYDALMSVYGDNYLVSITDFGGEVGYWVFCCNIKKTIFVFVTQTDVQLYEFIYTYMFLWYLIYFAKFNNYEFYIDICTDMSGIIIIIEIINTIVLFYSMPMPFWSHQTTKRYLWSVTAWWIVNRSKMSENSGYLPSRISKRNMTSSSWLPM